jgi:hypothetical protein
MKPLVLLIIILLVLAALFFTGVGGALGSDGPVNAKEPPKWLDGLASALPGSKPLDLKDVKASPSGMFKSSNGAVTSPVGGSVTLTVDPIESRVTKVRLAHIVVTSSEGVKVTFVPNDDGVFAKFTNKDASNSKPLDLSVPNEGATITISSTKPFAAKIKEGKSDQK